MSDTEKMKIWWNFQFNYSGKLEVLCIKSAQKILKILDQKIHQAPTEIFLIHRETECLWHLGYQNSGKKNCLERIHQPKPKERQFIIMKILQTRVNNFQIGISGLKIKNLSLKVTKHQNKVQKFHHLYP